MLSDIIDNHISTLIADENLKQLLQKTDCRPPVNTVAMLPEILLITSYPPRECGIATYSQDLVMAMNKKFNQSFKINICPIESENEQHIYTDDIKYILNKDYP